MDNKTVFVKTKEGEEAMRQRTRLVQRNLRSILIMVDGKATVADLSKRFGDRNAAQAALAELLAGGYIAEQLDQLDFTKAQPPEVRKEPAEDVPELTSQVAPPPAQDPPSAPPPAAEPPPLPPVIEEIELTAPEYESLPPPPLRPATPPKPVPPVAAGPGWMGRIKALLAKRGGRFAEKLFLDVLRGEDLAAFACTELRRRPNVQFTDDLTAGWIAQAVGEIGPADLIATLDKAVNATLVDDHSRSVGRKDFADAFAAITERTLARD